MGYPHGPQHLHPERHVLPRDRPATPLAIIVPSEHDGQLPAEALPKFVEERYPVRSEDVVNDHKHPVALSEVRCGLPITALTASGSAANCTP